MRSPRFLALRTVAALLAISIILGITTTIQSDIMISSTDFMSSGGLDMVVRLDDDHDRYLASLSKKLNTASAFSVKIPVVQAEIKVKAPSLKFSKVKKESRAQAHSDALPVRENPLGSNGKRPIFKEDQYELFQVIHQNPKTGQFTSYTAESLAESDSGVDVKVIAENGGDFSYKFDASVQLEDANGEVIVDFNISDEKLVQDMILRDRHSSDDEKIGLSVVPAGENRIEMKCFSGACKGTRFVFVNQEELAKQEQRVINANFVGNQIPQEQQQEEEEFAQEEDYVDYDQEEVEQGYEDTSETREDIEKSMFVF